MARLVLTGTAPASLPLEIRTDTVPTFDWRALQRWSIPENRLPANSIVRFRPQSFWQEYRWYIIAALIIIGVQTTIIVDLLLQRRRRRRVEAELRTRPCVLSSVSVQTKQLRSKRYKSAYILMT
jgi:hypothetical protein